MSNKLTEDHVNELKASYRFYHKEYWLHKMTYKHFKKVNLTCRISSAALVVARATIGALMLIPIVIGCVTGSVVLKAYCGVKNYRI